MTAVKTPPCLIFGLDGFDFKYAQTLAASGHMPWLRSILDQGSLVSTACAAFPGSEWVNMACGVDPASHGYLHTEQLVPGTYETRPIDATVVASEPFYCPIAQSGHRTIVVDLCVDRPRPNGNLTQLVDWATEFKLYHYCTSPVALKRSLPLHPLTDYGTTDPSEENLINLNEKLVEGTRLKGEVIRTLMDETPDWSLLFAGFAEIHKGGHFFWKYQDENYPGFCGGNHPLSGALCELYAELDRQMQAIFDKAGRNRNVIVVADRGMRPEYRGDHLIETLLQRLGLLTFSAPQNAGGGADAEFVSRSAAPGWSSRMARKLPVTVKARLRRLLGKERLVWRQTKVFKAPDVGNTYLRVNLQGREPHGIVRPEEVDDLLHTLEAELLSLKNPATGNCPIREVVFPYRNFHGPLRDQLPDIGIVWEDTAPIAELDSPTIGRVHGVRVPQRTGNHTEAGGFLVSGPSFRSGLERQGDLRELAPTLYQLFGIPPSTTHQLEPMPELVTSA